MSRFMVSDLYEDVSDINDLLERDGSSARLEVGGRNGYSAVDKYTVNGDGTRRHSGVDSTVVCGSPRECSVAAYRWYAGHAG